MIKVDKDISESKAFLNCLNFVENMPLMSNDESGVFTINYTKWLLNKFDLPYCFLEQTAQTMDSDGKILVATAQPYKSLININYECVNVLNMHELVLNLTHELNHVADYDYYINKQLLGKDRNFQSHSASFDIAEKYNLPFKNDEDYIYYYLKPEEITARQTSEFYTILFLKLLISSIKNPIRKALIVSKLSECLQYSKNSNLELLTYTFKEQNKPSFKAYIEAIKLITKNEIKKLEEFLKKDELPEDLCLKIGEMLLTCKDEQAAKNLALLYNKYNNREFRTFVLLTFASLPFNVLPESSVNKFLLTENNLTFACSYAAPYELAKRLLFIWGTDKFNKEIEKHKRNQNLTRALVYFKKVKKQYEDYNIVGLNNLPNTTMNKIAINRFVNRKFELNEETLIEYNKLTNGRFYTKINDSEQACAEKQK